MPKVNYEKAWYELKERKIQEYIKLHGEDGLIPWSKKKDLGIELSSMDNIDGSNDFGNLLYDLGIVKKTERE
ncbi:acetyltransferase [Staphylococcus phage PG-2021_4]